MPKPMATINTVFSFPIKGMVVILSTGRSPCRWCDYGFICCHEDGIGERALDAPAKPFEPPENSDKKKEEDQ